MDAKIKVGQQVKCYDQKARGAVVGEVVGFDDETKSYEVRITKNINATPWFVDFLIKDKIISLFPPKFVEAI